MTTPDTISSELQGVGQRLRFARAAAQNVRDEAKTLVLKAISAGMSETQIASTVGVDRMTVRSWQGK
jgi:DNA invertase Pin-like site-specific DNA recombinase